MRMVRAGSLARRSLWLLLLLLKSRGLSLARAVAELTSRHEDKTRTQSTA